MHPLANTHEPVPSAPYPRHDVTRGLTAIEQDKQRHPARASAIMRKLEKLDQQALGLRPSGDICSSTIALLLSIPALLSETPRPVTTTTITVNITTTTIPLTTPI